MTITGSDPTSGSGVQADVKTISELGGYAVTAVTSVTVQTSLGILEFFDLPASIVAGQIEAVMNDFQPMVVKIGLIRRLDVLDVIIDALLRYRPRHVIYDPLFMSSQGDTLVPDDVVESIQTRLLPLCTLVLDVDATQMHGLANRYASAVALFLCKGEQAEEARKHARAYLNAQTVRADNLQGRASELYNAFIDTLGECHRMASDVHFYADKLNVSSRYLAQVTRRISGKSPKSMIDEYLIHEIELQLNTTDNTVQQIAYMFGFSSQAHFTKFFKKLKGVSPTAYRKVKR